MKKFRFIFFTPVLLLLLSVRVAGGTAFDFSGWDTLLEKYVHKGTKENVRLTLINYKHLKEDNRFKDLLGKLEIFPVNNMKTKNEKISFWINVYNILAIKLVLDHYPVKSIKDIGSWFNLVWNEKAGIVGNRPYSLNDIEHGILRKMKEPHIHSAIVCASVSCPDITKQSYKPDNLSSQLDSQIRLLLANEGKGFFVSQDQSTIYVSSIYKWFKDDFQVNGGVINCLKKHAPEEKRKYLKYLETGDYSLKYLDFNWNLNEGRFK